MAATSDRIEDILTTPDAPGGYEGPSVVTLRDAGAIVPGQTFNALDYLRIAGYESGESRSIPEIFPTVLVLPSSRPTDVPGPADTGLETVDDEEGDPEDYRQTGIPGSSPGGPILVPPPSVLDYPPSYEYGVIPPIPEDVDVAVDWGTLFGDLAGGYVQAKYAPSPVMGLIGPMGGAAAAPSQTGLINQYTAPAATAVVGGNGCATCPTGSPRYSKICNATGEISPLRRRRRRRLLTAGDLSDIASLKAIVGGGAALNAAVVKAMK